MFFVRHLNMDALLSKPFTRIRHKNMYTKTSNIAKGNDFRLKYVERLRGNFV